MPSADPIPLAYANLRGDQPADSRFTVTTFADGVELTRPLTARWTTVATLVALAVGTLILTVLPVYDRLTARPRDQQWAEWPVVTVVLFLLVGLAGWLLRAAWTATRPRVQRIALRGDRITATHCLWTVTGRPWSMWHPRRVVATAGETDLFTGRRLGSVAVRGPLWVGRTVLTRMPHDECVWIAYALNAALAGVVEP